MDYANQAQAGRANLGMVGGGGGGAAQSLTLAARLEAAASMIAHQCSRLENTLAKVNGTPRSPQGPDSIAKAVQATAPLTMSVEAVEMHAKRLCELAANLEQVA